MKTVFKFVILFWILFALSLDSVVAQEDRTSLTFSYETNSELKDSNLALDFKQLLGNGRQYLQVWHNEYSGSWLDPKYTNTIYSYNFKLSKGIITTVGYQHLRNDFHNIKALYTKLTIKLF